MDIEFLRDLVIVIAGVAFVLWLIITLVVILLLFRKVSAVLDALRATGQRIQASLQSIRSTLSRQSKGGVGGILTTALTQVVQKVFRSSKGR